MTRSVIIILISTFVINILLGFGMARLDLYSTVVYVFLPLLLAGHLGARQFRRTEMRFMRIGERVHCALTSSIIIAILPIAFSLLLIILGGGTVNIDTLHAMFGVTAEVSVAIFISLAVYLLYSVPTLFVGLTIGQLLTTRRY